MKNKKRYFVRNIQVVHSDWEVYAESEKEAIEIAKKGLDNGIDCNFWMSDNKSSEYVIIEG